MSAVIPTCISKTSCSRLVSRASATSAGGTLASEFTSLEKGRVDERRHKLEHLDVGAGLLEHEPHRQDQRMERRLGRAVGRVLYVRDERDPRGRDDNRGVRLVSQQGLEQLGQPDR